MSVNIKQSGSLKKIAAFLPNNLITVSSLPDTDITNIQAGQSLVYDGELSKWVNYSAKIVVTYTDSFKGETITCTKGLTVISKTAPLDSNTLIFYVSSVGTWVVASGDFSVSVTVDNVGDVKYVELLSVPEGATVEPTDDIQIWLACANLDKPYTTLDAVLADRETFETLIADSNACDYMARSTSWALAEKANPTMTSNTTPSGVASASSIYSATYDAYQAFSENPPSWVSSGTTNQWLTYEFDTSKIIKSIELAYSSGNGRWNGWQFKGSDDGVTWNTLYSDTVGPSATTESGTYSQYFISNNTSYKYYGLFIDSIQSASLSRMSCKAKFYEADITRNPDAMSLIGKYDYCSNALLSNATWSEAIANSDYFEEVLNVKMIPTMTSNTAPSGTAYSSNTASDAWKAFDKNESTSWNTPSNGAFNIGYQSISSIKPYLVKVTYQQGSGAVSNLTFSYNNGTEWFNYEGSLGGEGNNTKYTKTLVLNNHGSTSNARCNISNGMSIFELQFYGRASSEVLIPLVPAMTSNTTPSGEVYTNSVLNATYAGWKAFNGVLGVANDGNRWVSASGQSGTNAFLMYDFIDAVTVNMVKIYAVFGNNSYEHPVSATIYIEGSTDNDTWEPITSKELTTTEMSQYTDIIFENNTAYRSYRVYFNRTNMYGTVSDYYSQIRSVQFYQRTVQTNIVHSCANDTIYYMEDGSPVIVATTNSDGDGILDFSSLEDKVYTLYSTVAKNPNDLTLPFTRRIRITNSQYGGTTERYLLPDTIRTLYWYGYNGGVEAGISANGWNHSATLVGCEFQTNKVYLNSTSSSTLSIVGSTDAHQITKTHYILDGIDTTGNGYYSSYSNKNLLTSGLQQDYAVIPTSVEHKVLTAVNVTNGYLGAQVIRSAKANLYGLWYDSPIQATPTFISAVNDSLYIMDGSTKIFIANTNGEGKSYEPLLEAGTYTIYSSVAKDPNNLSNPYSKTVTIDESTQTIVVMPENTLYWWGYKSNDCEENGFTFSGTKNSPTFDTTSVTLSVSASANTICSINTQNAITGTAKVIGYYTNREGSIWTSSSKAISGATETKVTTSSALYSFSLSNQYIALGVSNGSSPQAKSMTTNALWYE